MEIRQIVLGQSLQRAYQRLGCTHQCEGKIVGLPFKLPGNPGAERREKERERTEERPEQKETDIRDYVMKTEMFDKEGASR